MIENVAYYIPGIFDDSPQEEAVLRHMIEHHFIIKVIKLPDLDFDVAILSDLGQTARIIIDHINELNLGKDVILIGFSFGAILAIELAYQMPHAGYNVNYLCLIDCRLNPDNKKRSWRSFIEILFTHHGVGMLQRNAMLRLKRLFRNKAEDSRPVHPKYQLADFRRNAVRNWVPKQSNVKGTIIMSVFNFDRSKSVLADKLPNCKQFKVSCDHDHLLTGKYLALVSNMLSEELSAFLHGHG